MTNKKNSQIITFLANKHYRLYISLAIALIVFTISINNGSGTVSFMYTWISFAISNLFFSWIIILSFHPKDIKTGAREEDEGGAFIFLSVVLAAFISLFAIIALLPSIPGEPKRGLSLNILLTITSLFSSWTLIHTLFTLRYARLYYEAESYDDENNTERGSGLSFPNEKEPDFPDFAYFSFVLGMTFQVSDVQITSRKIRRLALLHSLLSFIYNTVIVAFSINIVAGIIYK